MAKITAFFYFQAVAFAVCICICEENEGLQREMEEFIDDVKVLINTLGYKVLEPLVKNEATVASVEDEVLSLLASCEISPAPLLMVRWRGIMGIPNRERSGRRWFAS